jgi:hypothetical protein
MVRPSLRCDSQLPIHQPERIILRRGVPCFTVIGRIPTDEDEVAVGASRGEPASAVAPSESPNPEYVARSAGTPLPFLTLKLAAFTVLARHFSSFTIRQSFIPQSRGFMANRFPAQIARYSIPSSTGWK